MSLILIADSGSTKTEWCLLEGNKKKTDQYTGTEPVFLNRYPGKGYFRERIITKTKKC